MQEVFITVLHRHLARRIQQLIPVSAHQYCFRPSGRLKALERAKRMLHAGGTLLQLDVKNAFGSIPHAQILKMLRCRNPGRQVVNYIERYLNVRYSDDLLGPHHGVGVPQGDPMSMFLFALGIDPVLEVIQRDLGDYAAYADDVIIALKPGLTPEEAVRKAVALYGEVGLAIQPDKCDWTGKRDPIYFLGHPFQQGQEESIARALFDKTKEKLKTLLRFPQLRRTAAYVIYNRTILPSVNYGPLVEMASPASVRTIYDDMDAELLRGLTASLALEPYQLSERDLLQLAVGRRAVGGLELMLPGAYFDAMTAHKTLQLEDNPTGKLKEEFFESARYRALGFQRPPGPAVAAVIPHADMLSDTELGALLRMRFRADEYRPERCPLCEKGPEDHTAECPGYMRQIWGVHNDILRILMDAMRGKRGATVGQRRMSSGDGYYLSDGWFLADDGRTYQVDVSVVWRGSIEERYNAKMSHSDTPHLLIPFVVSSDGTICPRSRARIQKAAPEITDDVLARVVLIPLAKRAAQRLQAVARASVEGVSQLVLHRSSEEDSVTAQVVAANPPLATAEQPEAPAAQDAEPQPEAPAPSESARTQSQPQGTRPAGQTRSTNPNLERAGRSRASQAGSGASQTRTLSIESRTESLGAESESRTLSITSRPGTQSESRTLSVSDHAWMDPGEPQRQSSQRSSPGRSRPDAQAETAQPQAQAQAQAAARLETIPENVTRTSNLGAVRYPRLLNKGQQGRTYVPQRRKVYKGPHYVVLTEAEKAALIARGEWNAATSGLLPPDYAEIWKNGLVYESPSYVYEEDDAV